MAINRNEVTVVVALNVANMISSMLLKYNCLNNKIKFNVPIPLYSKDYDCVGCVNGEYGFLPFINLKCPGKDIFISPNKLYELLNEKHKISSAFSEYLVKIYGRNIFIRYSNIDELTNIVVSKFFSLIFNIDAFHNYQFEIEKVLNLKEDLFNDFYNYSVTDTLINRNVSLDTNYTLILKTEYINFINKYLCKILLNNKSAVVNVNDLNLDFLNKYKLKTEIIDNIIGYLNYVLSNIRILLNNIHNNIDSKDYVMSIDEIKKKIRDLEIELKYSIQLREISINPIGITENILDNFLKECKNCGIWDIIDEEYFKMFNLNKKSFKKMSFRIKLLIMNTNFINDFIRQDIFSISVYIENILQDILLSYNEDIKTQLKKDSNEYSSLLNKVNNNLSSIKQRNCELYLKLKDKMIDLLFNILNIDKHIILNKHRDVEIIEKDIDSYYKMLNNIGNIKKPKNYLEPVTKTEVVFDKKLENTILTGFSTLFNKLTEVQNNISNIEMNYFTDASKNCIVGVNNKNTNIYSIKDIYSVNAFVIINNNLLHTYITSVNIYDVGNNEIRLYSISDLVGLEFNPSLCFVEVYDELIDTNIIVPCTGIIPIITIKNIIGDIKTLKNNSSTKLELKVKLDSEYNKIPKEVYENKVLKKYLKSDQYLEYCSKYSNDLSLLIGE